MATLDRFYSLPQRKLLNLSSQPVDRARATLKSYHDTIPDSVPWKDALKFYALNQMVAEITRRYTRFEHLPDDLSKIVDAYIKEVIEQSRRLSSYLMMITVREGRHYCTSDQKWWEDFANTHNPKATEFIRKKGQGGGETSILAALHDPIASPLPGVTIVELYQAVHDLFWTNTFGGGYGGPAWGRVTAPFVEMLRGRISMEMLVDVGYTLAHNGGPIFNKGMVYDQHDASTLINILNYQRAGMIVPGIKSENIYHGGQEDIEQMVAAFGKRFKIGDIDLGAVKSAKYDAQKQAEQQKQKDNEYKSKLKYGEVQAKVDIPEVVQSVHHLPPGSKFVSVYPVYPGHTAVKFHKNRQTHDEDEKIAIVNDPIQKVSESVTNFGIQAEAAAKVMGDISWPVHVHLGEGE